MRLSTERRNRIIPDDNVHDCPFCDLSMQRESEEVFSSEYFVGLLDRFPVNPGHMLLVTKRHVSSVFDLTSEEWAELQQALRSAREMLEKRYHPAGYNIGINCGRAAGQTIFHFHLHLIPRYEGDVQDPRGGIRNFKKSLVPYP